MYQALYRKWRPRTFDDVVGQEHITETLKNQVRSGRTSHAYLFVGTRGTGKTTCAKILAKAVNCQHPVNGNPCNECDACRGIDSGAILDVEELDAASNNGVDNVRALRDEAIFSPVHVKKRVYIIDEVHMLSTSAFNALLKILEEPPEHLLFILATTELHKIPATILSRCQRHSFKRIDEAVIAQRLSYVAQEEALPLLPEAAALLARLGDGSMRDALSLLDQCSGGETISEQTVLDSIGLAGGIRTAELMQTVADGDCTAALKLFDALWRDGKDISALLGEMSTLLRDTLLCKMAHGSSPLLSGTYALSVLEELGGKLSNAALLSDLKTLQKTISELKGSSDLRIPAELCLASLCLPAEETPQPAKPSKRPASAPVQTAKSAPQTEIKPISEPAPKAQPEPQPEMQPEPTPIAESEPEPEPMTETAAEPAAADDANFWKTLLSEVRDQIPPGNFSFLCEDFHAVGAMENGELVIRVKNDFAPIMLDVPEVRNPLSAALERQFGKRIPIRLAKEADASAPDTKKLEQLAKFENVKII